MIGNFKCMKRCSEASGMTRTRVGGQRGQVTAAARSRSGGGGHLRGAGHPWSPLPRAPPGVTSTHKTPPYFSMTFFSFFVSLMKYSRKCLVIPRQKDYLGKN